MLLLVIVKKIHNKGMCAMIYNKSSQEQEERKKVSKTERKNLVYNYMRFLSRSKKRLSINIFLNIFLLFISFFTTHFLFYCQLFACS